LKGPSEISVLRKVERERAKDVVVRTVPAGKREGSLSIEENSAQASGKKENRGGKWTGTREKQQASLWDTLLLKRQTDQRMFYAAVEGKKGMSASPFGIPGRNTFREKQETPRRRGRGSSFTIYIKDKPIAAQGKERREILREALHVKGVVRLYVHRKWGRSLDHFKEGKGASTVSSSLTNSGDFGKRRGEREGFAAAVSSTSEGSKGPEREAKRQTVA